MKYHVTLDNRQVQDIVADYADSHNGTLVFANHEAPRRGLMGAILSCATSRTPIIVAMFAPGKWTDFFACTYQQEDEPCA